MLITVLGKYVIFELTQEDDILVLELPVICMIASVLGIANFCIALIHYTMIYIVLNNSPFYGGGVEQVVRHVVTKLDKQVRSNLTLICNDPTLPERFTFQGVRCINFNIAARGLLAKALLYPQLKYSYAISRFIRRKINDGDVVNIHGLEYAFFPSLLKRKKYRLIVTAHGCYFEQFSDFLSKTLPNMLARHFFKFWRWYVWLIERLAVSGVDYLVFISNHSRDYYQKVYHIQKPSRVIPNGIQLGSHHKKSSKQSIAKAIIVGSASILKGLDIALETISRVNSEGKVNIQLDIVGFSNMNKDFAQLPSFARYVGRVSPDEIGKYYDEADFLLLPSRFEVFPLTMLEALRHGLPVIVSEACHLEEIGVGQEIGYTVKGYEIRDWQQAIERMCSKGNYERFAKEVRAIDFSKFDWNRIAKAYEQVFTQDI